MSVCEYETVESIAGYESVNAVEDWAAVLIASDGYGSIEEAKRLVERGHED